MALLEGVEINALNQKNRKAGDAVVPQLVITLTTPIKGQEAAVNEFMALMINNEPLIIKADKQQIELNMTDGGE